MKKIIIILSSLMLIGSYSLSLCQIEEDDELDPKKKDWEIYIAFSTHGGGAGSKFKWGNRENLQKYFSFEISGIRGKDEYVYYDPYSYSYPQVIRSRYMFIIPTFFGFQKRILKNTIEQNFRPYLDFEFGPIFGFRFPVTHGFTGNIKRGRIAVTMGGFAGIGVEGGDVTKNVFSFSMGYRIAYFFKEIAKVPNTGQNFLESNNQNFNAFVIRFGLITQF